MINARATSVVRYSAQRLISLSSWTPHFQMSSLQIMVCSNFLRSRVRHAVTTIPAQPWSRDGRHHGGHCLEPETACNIRIHTKEEDRFDALRVEGDVFCRWAQRQRDVASLSTEKNCGNATFCAFATRRRETAIVCRVPKKQTRLLAQPS